MRSHSHIKRAFVVLISCGLLLLLCFRNNYYEVPVEVVGNHQQNPGRLSFIEQIGNSSNLVRGVGVRVEPSNQCNKMTRCEMEIDLNYLKCLLGQPQPPNSQMKNQELTELSRTIQKRLHDLQNPPDCKQAKKLICSLKKRECGLGCQINHLVYCMVVAYANRRTLILISKTDWPYKEGWDDVFLPISESCTTSFFAGGELRDWQPGNHDINDDEQVLFLPAIQSIRFIPAFLPPALPSDVAGRLEKVHEQPNAWWVGQFLRYLLKLKPEVQALLDEVRTKMGLESPTVGVHIRRTDKKREAKFYALEEYMKHVKDYFRIQEALMEGKEVNLTRRVFIATDDPNVLKEAYEKYSFPKWKIIANSSVAAINRLENGGLLGIVIDLFLLSECDFLVCTFSSNVCRVAYEIMQTKRVDASRRAVSLDAIYYFYGGSKTIHMAQSQHTPGFSNSNELELFAGDEIKVVKYLPSRLWNGTNLRTNKTGLYPTCKVRTVYAKLDFPKKKWWSQSQND